MLAVAGERMDNEGREMRTDELQLEKAVAFVAKYNLARAGGNVRRYHTHRVLCEDTVASHSWGVAVILDILFDGGAPAKLLRAALYHDVAEHVYGDIPSPAKRLFNSDELRKCEDSLMKQHGMFTVLNDWERYILKIADLLDGLNFCTEERERGNGTLISVWNTYYEYIKVKLADGLQQFPEHMNSEVFRNIGHINGVLWARMEQANAQR